MKKHDFRMQYAEVENFALAVLQLKSIYMYFSLRRSWRLRIGYLAPESHVTFVLLDLSLATL